MNQNPIRIGIITASDRAARGAYEDRSGPAIEQWLRDRLTSPWQPVYHVVPDDRERLERELMRMADEEGCCLIVTTGGTGPAPRDVTPEATEAVCDKMLPGFGELMRSVSYQHVPTAILSRQTAGIRGRTLIVNLPGKPKAIGECLEVIFPAIPDCLDVLGGPRLECDPEKLNVYRAHDG